MSGAGHVVAVVGGATAGAEIAARLSERGVTVVVLEQNTRPYGKIEDGLPRWHVNLRRKEYDTIDRKMTAPGVHLVPHTRLGRDIFLDELAREWGFSAVVLANGAWRDRPLPLQGAEAFVGKGLLYQNPLIISFNHQHDPAWKGPRHDVADGVPVVGGGLASLDVMKLLMLGTVHRSLTERGVNVGHFEEFEQTGIPETLEKHGLTLTDLGLRGATLYYRRRIEDMPLAEIPADATPERRTKVEATRRKVLEKAQEKFAFHVEPLCAPDALLVEGDRVVGMRIRRQKLVDGKPVPTDDVFEHRAPFVVSSIGSIPEPLNGVPMKGDVLDVEDAQTSRIRGYPNVFSTGNVVTGKGNIVASRKHAAHVGTFLTESYLGLGPPDAKDAITAGPEARGAQTAAAVAQHLSTLAPLPPDRLTALLGRIKARQTAVGFTDYASWMKANPPPPDDAAGH